MLLDITGQEPDNKLSRLRIVARVLLFVIGCALILALVGPMVPKLPGMRSEIVLGTIATLWALVLTFVFVWWEGLSLEEVAVVPDVRSPARFALGFAIGLLIVVLWWSALAVFSDIKWVPIADAFCIQSVIVLVAFIVLSCREELAFHGYPLQRLKGSFGIWRALLFMALLFAVEHMAGGWTWTQALLGSGVGSLMFGMAAIASRGLALPIGLHAAWNFGHWSLGHKGQPGIWEAVISPGFEDRAQFVGMAAYLTVMCSATLAFWLWYRRRTAFPQNSQ